MGKHEKRAYLEAIRNRYRKAKRTDKGKIPGHNFTLAIVPSLMQGED